MSGVSLKRHGDHAPAPRARRAPQPSRRGEPVAAPHRRAVALHPRESVGVLPHPTAQTCPHLPSRLRSTFPARPGRPAGGRCTAGRRHPADRLPEQRAGCRHPERRRRDRQPLRVELELRRHRVHHRARPQGLRRRPGRPAGRLDQAERRPPLVGGLPARLVRPEQPDGHRGAVQGHGHDLPQRRCEGLRRRGDQPHRRRQPDQHQLVRRSQLQHVELHVQQHPVRPRRLPQFAALPQRRPEHHRLEQRHPGPGVPTGLAVRREHRVGLRPRQDRRLPEQHGRLRCGRLPGGYRQAHRPDRHGQHPLPGARHHLGRAALHLPGDLPGRQRPARRGRVRGQRQRAGVHLRLQAQGAVQRQHRQPEDVRPELGT